MKAVLVVDDSPTIRRMVKVALADVADTFLEAASGLEAIEQVTKLADPLGQLADAPLQGGGVERRRPAHASAPRAAAAVKATCSS
jgi:CheY-like chemotaxis protein